MNVHWLAGCTSVSTHKRGTQDGHKALEYSEASPEAGNVEKIQEDTSAESSPASPEAGNVEKTQEC